MAPKTFRLSATVINDKLPPEKPVLDCIFEGKGTVKETNQGFRIEDKLEGDLKATFNRKLLSELRSEKKRTQMRSQWISENIIDRCRQCNGMVGRDDGIKLIHCA